MEHERFDNLTRALATTTSRRQFLKTLGGGLLAVLVPGQVLAKNRDCAKFCKAVFGADTPAADQCISDAAHGTGLCQQCGSVNPSSICCTRNASNYCTSYSGAACCSSSATCLNGSCCANANVCGSTCLAAPCDSSQCLTCDTTNGTCVGCPQGQTCVNGTCCSTSQVCNGVCCASGHSCLNGSCCPNDQVCGSSCGCPSGQTCQNGTCVTPTFQPTCVCNSGSVKRFRCQDLVGCEGFVTGFCGSACGPGGFMSATCPPC
jgi:hypothetical protein